MIELDASRAGKLGRVAAAASSDREGPPMVQLTPELMALRQSGEAPKTQQFGPGQIAGRLLRGDLAEAGADAVGYGLKSLYKQLDDLGFQSGEEFVAAFEEAAQLESTLVLGDRDAKVTVRR